MTPNIPYMLSMALVAQERGYNPFEVAATASHKEWLAFCYEIHDQTIIRWRHIGGEYVPFWTTYRFRQYLNSILVE